jgi:hypothetical protein
MNHRPAARPSALAAVTEIGTYFELLAEDVPLAVCA